MGEYLEVEVLPVEVELLMLLQGIATEPFEAATICLKLMIQTAVKAGDCSTATREPSLLWEFKVLKPRVGCSYSPSEVADSSSSLLRSFQICLSSLCLRMVNLSFSRSHSSSVILRASMMSPLSVCRLSKSSSHTDRNPNLSDRSGIHPTMIEM